MSETLAKTTTTALARLAPRLDALDVAAAELHAIVASGKNSPSYAIRQAAAMKALRDMLDDEMLEPICALQNSPVGMRTDRQGGYDAAVVREVAITAMARGGNLTMNRTNIIAGNYYATKEQFGDWLDQRQGRGRWAVVHGVPRAVRGNVTRKDKRTGEPYTKTDVIIGAVVESVVKWQDGDSWREEKLTHAVSGDEYSTADAFLGKADRKCRAWLYGQITGDRVPDGEADDHAVNITDEGADVKVAGPSPMADAFRPAAVVDQQPPEKPSRGKARTPDEYAAGTLDDPPVSEGQSADPTVSELISALGNPPADLVLRAVQSIFQTAPPQSLDVIRPATIAMILKPPAFGKIKAELARLADDVGANQ